MMAASQDDTGPGKGKATSVESVQGWFSEHVTLEGKPYTLDTDQAQAVLDAHKNTLVTARAGSGKTRVIVAKIAYLIATKQAHAREIVAFMFNRTAAAEVNERVQAVKVDGEPIIHPYRSGSAQNDASANLPHIASTFHKFALDLVKMSGARPEILSEAEHGHLVRQALSTAVSDLGLKLSPREQSEQLLLASSFVTRAGQKFFGAYGQEELRQAIMECCQAPADNPDQKIKARIHRIAYHTYLNYLESVKPPRTDFNQLLVSAADLLESAVPSSKIFQNFTNLKYILVDEYQDFSYLFFNLIQSLRKVCPAAHLFAVGDDWQAINRFAGSDVDYFLNFAEYFPEDSTNIPLLTNYRSCRKIVENANDYMLKNYAPEAARARAFNRKTGKVARRNPQKTRFDPSDLQEDQLGDAQFQLALASNSSDHNLQKRPAAFTEAARLLKTSLKILKRHRRQNILFLHRHNFFSMPGVTLDSFLAALRLVATSQNLLSETEFNQRVRILTMHRSKGLESDVVVLLEFDREQVLSKHPHATIFELFGDTRIAELADQHRLIYVALTRAKERLYILSSDKKPVA